MIERPDQISLFVERVKRERLERGQSPTITDPATLAVIAALVARREGVVADGFAA